MCDLCFDDEFHLHEEDLAEFLRSRADSDERHFDFIWADAHREDVDRDHALALFDHDRFLNQCKGYNLFGARCVDRHGHSGPHDATFNGYMKFVYSEKKLRAVLYNDNPLLRMLR